MHSSIICQKLHFGKYVRLTVGLFVCPDILSRITHECLTYLYQISHADASWLSTNLYRFSNQSNKNTCQNINFGKSATLRVRFNVVCCFVVAMLYVYGRYICIHIPLLHWCCVIICFHSGSELLWKIWVKDHCKPHQNTTNREPIFLGMYRTFTREYLYIHTKLIGVYLLLLD